MSTTGFEKYDGALPDPICMMCGEWCNTWEIVEIGTEDEELWCFCEKCDIDTFRPFLKKEKKIVEPKILTFDAEIQSCILGDGETVNKKYQYCKGWKDYEGMGISFLGAFSSATKAYRIYEEDEILDFLAAIEQADIVAGFNILAFDIPLIKGTLRRLGHPEKTGMAGKVYDLCADIRRGRPKGCGRDGWRMDDVAVGTLNLGKAGDGAEAPRLWQDGKIGRLVSYLIRDVQVEHSCVLHAFKKGFVKNRAGETAQCAGSPVWREWQTTGRIRPPVIGPDKNPEVHKPQPRKAAAGAAPKGVYPATSRLVNDDLPFPTAGVQPQ